MSDIIDKITNLKESKCKTKAEAEEEENAKREAKKLEAKREAAAKKKAEEEAKKRAEKKAEKEKKEAAAKKKAEEDEAEKAEARAKMALKNKLHDEIRKEATKDDDEQTTQVEKINPFRHSNLKSRKREILPPEDKQLKLAVSVAQAEIEAEKENRTKMLKGKKSRHEDRQENRLKRAQQVENLLSELYKIKPENATQEQIKTAEIVDSLVEEKVSSLKIAKNIPSSPAKSSSSIRDKLKNIGDFTLPKSFKIWKYFFKKKKEEIDKVKTKQEQLKKQLTQIETEKQRLQQQLKEAKDSKQNEEITQRKIERLEEVEKSSKESIKQNKSLIEQLKKEKAELEETRSEKQKAVIELMKIKEEEKRKQKEEFLENKGEALRNAIEKIDKKNFNMSEIKIKDIEEGYPTLHDKIKNFLVFKEDELIKAHHAKFYSDNIKRNNNKLVETLKLVPSEPFLGIEGLAFGTTQTEKSEEEKEIESLKAIKEKVRDFIKDRADYIFDLSQHHKLSVKEYLKTL